jgi:hypothetical protein
MPALSGVIHTISLTALNEPGKNDAWERWLPAGCAESNRVSTTLAVIAPPLGRIMTRVWASTQPDGLG